MNRCHRVVWSAARGTFIAVAENTASRGKPAKSRVAHAVAAIALSALAGSALAACPPNPTISTALTSPTAFCSGSATITAQGSVVVNTTGGATAAIGESENNVSVTNQGLISLTTTTTGSGIEGMGLSLYSGEGTVVLNNQGRIQAAVSATGEGESETMATGLLINSTMRTGSVITNSGTISASMQDTNTSGDHNSNAVGVVTSSINAGSTVTNTGTISGTSTGISDVNVEARGFTLDEGGLYGALNNSGQITAQATASHNAEVMATGVGTNSMYGGSFNNSGNIAAQATGGESTEVTAHGVSTSYMWNASTTPSTINNSGTISVRATGGVGSNVKATALNITQVGEDSSVTNSGTLAAQATTATHSQVEAHGVSINLLKGTLQNSGTISGTISMEAGEGYTTGVRVDAMDEKALIRNSGVIRATLQNDPLGERSPAYSLHVARSAAGARIENLAGGLLDGRVYVGEDASLSNDGTLNTRLQQSYVGGNYTQGGTGVLYINALQQGSSLSYGSLAVGEGSTASFAPNSRLHVEVKPGSDVIAANAKLNSVVTAGQNITTMSNIRVTDNVISRNFVTAYGEDGTNQQAIDLRVVDTGMTSVANAAAVSGNSFGGLATSLDTLLANISSYDSEFQNVLWNVGSASTTDEVKNLLNSLSPQQQRTILDAGAKITQTIQSRQNESGRSSGSSFYGDGRMWVKPFYSTAKQDDRNGVTGYRSDTYGAVVGWDGTFSEKDRMGGGFAIAKSDVDGNSSISPQNANVDSYQFIFYGSHQLGQNDELNYQVDLGWHNNETTRNNIAGTGLAARGDFDSRSFHIGGGYAKTMPLSEISNLTPSIRLDYTQLRDDGYTETGAGGAGLVVNSVKTKETLISVDAKYTRQISTQSVFSANAGFSYNLNNDTRSITSAFAGAPGTSFTTFAAEPQRTTFKGGLGWNHRLSEMSEVTARYDLEARSSFVNQTLSVKYRWSF